MGPGEFARSSCASQCEYRCGKQTCKHMAGWKEAAQTLNNTEHSYSGSQIHTNWSDHNCDTTKDENSPK